MNYEELPLNLLATLSFGLRENSRTKMRINKQRIDSNQTLLVAILDMLQTLVWLNTSNGYEGKDRPKSILDSIMNPDEEKFGFDSSTDFEEYREKLIKQINERSTDGRY